MVARDKFKIGKQVRLSRAGLAAFAHQRGYSDKLRGWVYGFGRTPSAVIIQRDDNHHAEPFHMDHWEVVDGE